MKTGYERRLDKSFRNALVLPINLNSRIVLISDCHRGVGNTNDNFLKNQNLYFAALRYYYTNNFTYIELGDGDELWENRSIAAIHEIHGDVFYMLSLFANENRLYQIYGNHDHILKYDTTSPHYEGIILKACGIGKSYKCIELYLTHGHQADLLNSTLWRLSRFLVRYIWKPLEQLGVLDPTSAAKNYKHRNKSEKRLSHWAIKNNRYLITGHTHRPSLDDANLHYFNTGSCVHPRCITCIEIDRGMIYLVKWLTETRTDNSLYVARTVISNPINLCDL